MNTKIVILLFISIGSISAISFTDTVLNFGMSSNNKQTLRIQTEVDISKSFSGVFRLGMNKSLGCGVCYKNPRVAGLDTTLELVLDPSNNNIPIGLLTGYYKKSFDIEGVNGPFGLKLGFYQTIRYMDSFELHKSKYDRGIIFFIEKYIS